MTPPHVLTKEVYYSTECLVNKLDYLDQIGFQLTPGAHKIEYNTVIFEDCLIMKLTMKNSTLFEGICDDSYIYFAVPEKNISIIVNGYPLSYQELYIMAPTKEIKAVFPNNFAGYYLGISKSNLEKIIGPRSVNYILKNRDDFFSGKIQLSHIDVFKNSLLFKINFLIKHFSTLSEIAKLDLKDSILSSLCSLQIDSLFLTGNRKVFNKSLAVAQRAKSYIVKTPNKYLSVLKVCENSFCSLRTLEYAFQRVYNVTPKKYLIIKRLHTIRNELLSSKSKPFKEIILDNGIINIGRFNNDYHYFFGEYPIETLKHSKFKKA